MKNRKRLVMALCSTGAAVSLLFLAGCSAKETILPAESVVLGESSSAESAGAENGTAAGETEPDEPVETYVPLGEVRVSEVSAIDAVCAPSGIAAMADGAILVTDIYNKKLWQVQAGTSEVYAGADSVRDLYGEPLGGYSDDVFLSSRFRSPWAVAEFLGGWAVSDTDNGVVRILRDQKVQTLNARTEEKLAVGDAGVIFDRPTGLAADEEGNLYVADTGNGAVRKISTKGEVSTVADGLNEPMGLCWKRGALYIAETGGNRIVKVKNGKLSTVAGGGAEGYEDGEAGKALFAAPQGVAVGEDGAVYVADTLNSAVRRICAGQVDTVLARDVSAAGFGLTSPAGLLVQGKKLYVCDSFARKLYVLEWD